MFSKSDFIELLTESVGDAAERISEALFADDASRGQASIRVNPLKGVLGSEFLGCEGASFEPVSWCSEGFFLAERPVFTLDPLFHAGAYYVQDSSSMAVGAFLQSILASSYKGGFLRVLDLCAAPGGKTTHLASILRSFCGADFLLVANEVVPARMAVLRDNVCAWGDPNVVVTSLDSKVFGSKLRGFFDIILTDVPCSGEGMFRKEPDAVSGWSLDAVRMCAARSKTILEGLLGSASAGSGGFAGGALAEGGLLIYSTCTFNHFENDDTVGWLVDSYGLDPLPVPADFVPGMLQTRFGGLLAPGFVPGEGQFFAGLAAGASVDGALEIRGSGSAADALKQVRKSLPNVFIPSDNYFELKGRDKIPTQVLAGSIEVGEYGYPTCDVDLPTALKYLRRENILLPSDYAKGYVLITYKGLPLGFVNNLLTRTNNLYPKSRAIRMR